MYAYHIMGFTSFELGLALDQPNRLPEIQGRIEARFKTILQEGLTARNARQEQEQGRSFWQDTLAGDDRYIFLSVGERYSRPESLPAACVYGFVFHAESLLHQGAILGIKDLMEEYSSIIEESVEEIAAGLPRKPEISEAELDRFMEGSGENPRIREFIRLQSMNPADDVYEAIKEGDTSCPGYREALCLCKSRIRDLHRRTRLTGQEALSALQEGCEILVKDTLDISQALHIIRGGSEYVLS